MVVREQPAPRGQVVHRDGTREYFCSVGDMVHYLAIPSPHGASTGVFVELVPADADPLEHNLSPMEWVDAESAIFVVGVPRERIMGPPVLVYESPSVAKTVAGKHDGKVVNWESLRADILRAPTDTHKQVSPETSRTEH
jgi:nitrous oxide reductase accessory protein NosL